MTADALLVADLVAMCVTTGVMRFVQVVHHPVPGGVGTNRVRTSGWTIRAALVASMTLAAVGAASRPTRTTCPATGR